MRLKPVPSYSAIILLPSFAAGHIKSAIEPAKSGQFDATGEVACAQEVRQRLGACTASVARDGGSVVAVVVLFTNAFGRALMFEDGQFLRDNATMSGVGTDTDWRLPGGIFRIRLDDPRFELPEALVMRD